MKKKHKQILSYTTPLILLIVLLSLSYYSTREIKFEDVYFEDVVENITNETSPHYVFFTLANYRFEPADCTATLSLTQGEEILNETTYNLGRLNSRAKLKYKILFNMPQGDTNIKVTKDCKPN
jgi:hypothetical protein